MTVILDDLITIVIPVYNSAQFLTKCLESVALQTYKNLDIILVNDGSTDNSGEICKAYQYKFKNVRYVHQANCGISAVRKLGIRLAKGKYLIFIDSDDYVEPNYIESLYRSAKVNDGDIVICNFKIHNGSKSYIRLESGSTDPNILINQLLEGKIHGSSCNKLVKMDLVGDDLILPEQITMCEDLLLNVYLISKSFKVSYVDEALYNYVQNTSSITNFRTKKSFLSQIAVAKLLEEIFKNDSRHKESLLEFKLQIIRDIMLFGQQYKFEHLFPEVKGQILKSKSLSYYQKIALYLKFKNINFLYLLVPILKSIKR